MFSESTKDKRCTKCTAAKSIADFNRDRKRKDGLQPHCRECQRTYAKSRKSELAAPGGYWARYYANHKDADKNRALLKHYGISLQAYTEMVAQQAGVCAICYEPCATGRALSVDHDHRTSLVRGLLCKRCNTGLGAFRDSPALLLAALRYLDKYRSDEG